MFDPVRTVRAGVSWVKEKLDPPDETKPAPAKVAEPEPVKPQDGVEPVTAKGGAPGATRTAWANPGDGVDLVTTNALATPAQKRAPNPNPADAAGRILDVGSRFGTDDYDARSVAFAQELEKGDANYRADLTAEILKRDPGAFASWLTPERANAMQNAGRISREQKGLIAEGVAGAYNRGRIGEHEIGVGPVPGTGADGKVRFNELDNVIGAYHSPTGLGGGYDQVGNAQRVRAFIDFASSSNSPEVAKFRETYAKHLIDQFVLNPAVGYNNPVQRDAAAGLAANLLAANSPESAVKALAGYGKKVPDILEAAARSNHIYGEDVLKVPAGDRRLDPKDVSVYDGANLLMLSLARVDKSASDPELNKAIDSLSVEMARLPTTKPAIFEGPGGKDRVDALTLAFSRHPDAILEQLTDYDSKLVASAKNPKLQQYMQNASELGTLFKLTLFNPDSTYREMLQGKVVDYANGLSQTINQPGAGGDAVGRMAMLQAGLTDAVRQGYEKLATDEAARKQVMGFVLDLALSALPAGKWAQAPVENIIMTTFASSPKLQDALKGLSGKLIDSTTGKLTDEAKKTILDTLGKEAGSLEIAMNAVNQLNDTFMKSLDEKDYDRNQVQSTYNQILNGISIARAK